MGTGKHKYYDYDKMYYDGKGPQLSEFFIFFIIIVIIGIVAWLFS